MAGWRDTGNPLWEKALSHLGRRASRTNSAMGLMALQMKQRRSLSGVCCCCCCCCSAADFCALLFSYAGNRVQDLGFGNHNHTDRLFYNGALWDTGYRYMQESEAAVGPCDWSERSHGEPTCTSSYRLLFPSP